MTASRIGLNLYSLRQFCQTPQDIANTLHKVRAMGYELVQISGLGPIEPKELKRILDGEGLGVCATHIPYPSLVNDLPRVIDNHYLWGCTNVALGSLPSEMRNYDGFVRFAHEGSEIGRKLAEARLTFSYHNHAFEFEKFNGRLGMDIIYGDSDPRYLLAEIDTYWVQHGGGDPAAWIRRLKGRQTIVHLKDMGVVNGTPTLFEVGEGNLNWPAILDACREVGITVHIVEQDTFVRDPFESVATSLRNLKAMGL